MKNIHVLPTDKPSRLYLHENNFRIGDLTTAPKNLGIYNQNIYITSDEEIKDGDWYLDTFNTQRIKANQFSDHKHYGNACKKIILTTDLDLIKDGVQAIDDEFLEWFVKNPSCEFVEIIKIEDELISPKNPKIRFNALQDPPSFISAESLNNMILTYKYKITIPKEELSKDEIDKFFVDMVCNPKEEPKQETLEEDIIMELQKDPLLIDFDNQVNKKIDSLKKHQEFVDKTDSKTLDLLMSEFDGEEELLIQASKKIWEEQHPNPIEMALFGFRLQQEQYKNLYSKEDIKIAFTEGHNSARLRGSYKFNGTFEEDWNEWFEQFKNK